MLRPQSICGKPQYLLLVFLLISITKFTNFVIGKIPPTIKPGDIQVKALLNIQTVTIDSKPVQKLSLNVTLNKTTLKSLTNQNPSRFFTVYPYINGLTSSYWDTPQDPNEKTRFSVGGDSRTINLAAKEFEELGIHVDKSNWDGIMGFTYFGDKFPITFRYWIEATKQPLDPPVLG